MLDFWSTTYLSCLVDGCYNDRLFQWVRFVLRYSTIGFYALMRQTSFKGFSRKKNRKLAQTFHCSFRCIDDVLSLNNSRFGDYLHRIYVNKLEVKDITDTQKSASYLDLHLEIDNGGRIQTKLYDKREDLTFLIVNFPFIICNITSSAAYGVYISQLIRYCRVCAPYSDFLDRSQLLTHKLLKQGYVAPKLN